jgi:hypothetical protein
MGERLEVVVRRLMRCWNNLLSMIQLDRKMSSRLSLGFLEVASEVNLLEGRAHVPC